mmetsp:Transcript_2274/g.6899  ORF Transcript_2274/g.6899 Transcript_2274/m.6899 type:complete len:253 (+) Transcript_2274:498-1256(+)
MAQRRRRPGARALRTGMRPRGQVCPTQLTSKLMRARADSTRRDPTMLGLLLLSRTARPPTTTVGPSGTQPSADTGAALTSTRARKLLAPLSRAHEEVVHLSRLVKCTRTAGIEPGPREKVRQGNPTGARARGPQGMTSSSSARARAAGQLPPLPRRRPSRRPRRPWRPPTRARQSLARPWPRLGRLGISCSARPPRCARRWRRPPRRRRARTRPCAPARRVWPSWRPPSTSARKRYAWRRLRRLTLRRRGSA